MTTIDILRLIMLVTGIYALGNGRLKLSHRFLVQGIQARLIGAVLILPVPIAFGAGFVKGFLGASEGGNPDDYNEIVRLVSLSSFVGCLATGSILFVVWSILWHDARFDPPDAPS